MAPSFSRVSSGALLLALAYNARSVNADFWEDVDNCKLVLDDLPADLTTEFCHDWTYGYQPEDEYVTVTGYPVTVTEYPDAKTCEGEGYSTTTKYPESTPEPSKGYKPSEPTKVPDESTKVPDESTKVPDETTKAPDHPPATDVPGGYDVTVTSTSWTTYWTTSTVYEDYPAATPASYRRHARNLKERAAWCVDRPCRLVQYDDDTIGEACKKYLGWEAHTSTVEVPGYTITVTSYPTDCKKKGDSYEPEPVSAYPTEKDEGYEPEPYSTETPEAYSTKNDYPTETSAYPKYPEETPEYEPEPAPASYPEDEPDYDNGPSYNDESTDDYQDSGDSQPWQDDFDNTYSGPDGPLPWDDSDQTSELADAIAAGGYDDAAQNLGLEDAPWNALPVDYPQKRDYPTEDSSSSYAEDEPEGDYDVVWVDEDGYPIKEEEYPHEEDSYTPEEDSYTPEEDFYTPEEDSYTPEEDSYKPEEDSYKQEEDSYKPEEDSYKQEEDSYKPAEDSYKAADKSSTPAEGEYAPNVYGPDVPESGEYEDSGDYEDYTDDHSPDYYQEPEPELPDSSEYEGDEFESDFTGPVGGPSDASPDDYWGGDGVDY